ncbi:MAG: DUF1553 domain-containing protein, partial [Planctomycetota bacterium]
ASEDAADKSEETGDRLAMRFDGERGVRTFNIEPFDRWMSFSVVMTIRDAKRSPLRSVLAHHTRGTDCGYNGWDFAIRDGFLDVRLGRVWPGNAISVRTTEPIPEDKWCQVSTTYDGSSQAGGIRIFLNGKELPTEVIRDELKKQCNVKVDHGGEFVIGQRFRDRGFAGGLIDDVRVYGRRLTRQELVFLATGHTSDVDFETYVSTHDHPSRQAHAELTEARKRLVMVEESMDEIPVMREMKNARPAHVLARGEYDAETNQSTLVSRNVPLSEMMPLPEAGSPDRMTLAKWVTDPRHPLTARVAVNRLWANFFGAGLVGTPENFGLQGDLPTHPELLDWISRDFIDSGWDIKRLCKQIVLSSAYRQDSKATSENVIADPENRLLSRGPSHRLAAEQIRDMALAASGLMNREIGGPPVSPYQPGEDLWRESNGMSPAYQQSVGQSLYRRSLYSVWKRTAPLPNMLAFDSTTREVCTVKRSRTNTPLQALVLLNDIQFVEAARILAASIIGDIRNSMTEIEASSSKEETETSVSHQSSSLTEDRIREMVDEALLRLAGRPATDDESKQLVVLFLEEHEFFTGHPDHAADLIGHGDARVDALISPNELAAMTVVCQVILNLDATIWKR